MPAFAALVAVTFKTNRLCKEFYFSCSRDQLLFVFTRYRTRTDNPTLGADFESAVYTNFTKRVFVKVKSSSLVE